MCVTQADGTPHDSPHLTVLKTHKPGRVVGVQDGDTITLLGSSNANHRIGLLGIDAPESGQEFCTQSKQNLSEAIFNKVVTIEWSKHDRYRRIGGKVRLNGARRLHGVGMAWHYGYYQDDQTPEDTNATRVLDAHLNRR